MHWLAFVLSDHPHQDSTRDTCIDEMPRHVNATTVVRRPAAAFEGSMRSVPASRRISTVSKSAAVHS